MYRVEQISLLTTSPIGCCLLGGIKSLSEFDLILIVGANGTGKTELTRPLRELGEQLLLERGTKLTKRDVDPYLLCTDGRKLMGEFESPNAALAKAAGVQRLQDEVKVLDSVLNVRAQSALQKLKVSLAPVADANLGQARDQYEQAERGCSEKLGDGEFLTLATYNRLASQIAQLLGKQPQQHQEINADSMQAQERDLMPVRQVLAGLDVIQATAARAATLEAHSKQAPELTKALDRAQSALRECEVLLTRTTSDATALLGAAVGDPLDQACEDCRNAAEALEEEADGSDKKSALKQRAIEHLENSHPANCPVCAQGIVCAEVIGNLRQELGCADKEAQGFRDRAKEFVQVARDLSNFSTAQAEADRVVAGVLGRVRALSTAIAQEFGSLREALAPQMGWNQRVVDSVKPLRESAERCRLAIKAVPEGTADTLQSAAQEALSWVAQVRTALRQLNQAGEALNADVGRAETLHGRLAPLRRALTAAQTLNAIAWAPGWEAEQAARRRDARIDEWIAAAERLRDQGTMRIQSAQVEILKDPNVIARFDRFMGALQHPLLREPRLLQGGVVGKVGVSQAVDKNLSEGYRVLVNLAAFVAVVGHCVAGQAHQAGWVLIDEPTNGLDSALRTLVASALGGLSRDQMPRQMFVTTFDTAFADELLTNACATDRRTLKIELAPWTSTTITPPTETVIPHRESMSS